MGGVAAHALAESVEWEAEDFATTRRSNIKNLNNTLQAKNSDGTNKAEDTNKAEGIQLTQEDKAKIIKKAEQQMDKEKVVLSYGGAGFKGKYVPGKFHYYKIHYPKYSFKDKEDKKEFLKKMSKTRPVPNSIFCFVGSGRIYRKAIKDIK